jgi:hypothetical protein
MVKESKILVEEFMIDNEKIGVFSLQLGKLKEMFGEPAVKMLRVSFCGLKGLLKLAQDSKI